MLTRRTKAYSSSSSVV